MCVCVLVVGCGNDKRNELEVVAGGEKQRTKTCPLQFCAASFEIIPGIQELEEANSRNSRTRRRAF